MTGRTIMAGAAALVLAACGGRHHTDEDPCRDMKPLKEIAAIEAIEKVLDERDIDHHRSEDIWLVGYGWYEVDIMIDDMPLAIEYYTEKERAGVLASADTEAMKNYWLPSKSGDSYQLYAVGTEEIGEGDEMTLQNSIFAVVLYEKDYMYQPNPTSENRCEFTLFEIEKRIRTDAVDVIEEVGRVIEDKYGDDGDGEETDE